jgi:hypothetical protein
VGYGGGVAGRAEWLTIWLTHIFDSVRGRTHVPTVATRKTEHDPHLDDHPLVSFV